MRSLLLIGLVTAVATACVDPVPDDNADTDPDVQSDTGTDTGTDTEPDAEPDADATPDATPDADAGTDAEPDVNTPRCGDGRRDPDEACDDGNTSPGDGCGPSCDTERCGDGEVQPALGEECEGADVRACATIGMLGDGRAECSPRTCTWDRGACAAPPCPPGGDPACAVDPYVDRPGDGCFGCAAERCIASVDADRDGVADCDQTERCDGIDNDGDGVVDEGDFAGLCSREPICGAERCACVDGTLRVARHEPAAAERCNGSDDDCDGVGDAPECDAGAPLEGDRVALRELALAAGPADLLVLVDRTQSSAGAAAVAASWVATQAAAAPDWLWIGAAGAGDIPGIDGGDGPLSAIWVPITGERSLTATLALDPSSAWRGGREPDAAHLAIWQVATAGEVGWNAPVERSTALEPGTIGWLGPADPVDTYTLEATTAARVVVDVAASRLGSAIDLRVVVRDAEGRVVAANDDATWLDPRVVVGPGQYTIAVEPCCGVLAPDAAPGWYSLRVRVDATPYVATAEACLDADPDGVALFSTALGVGSAWPAAPGCLDACARGVPAAVAAAMCGEGRATGRCGDGRLDWGEVCDDQNLTAGDGCDGFCARAPGGHAALDAAAFAHSALFNNRRDRLAFGSGGVAWRPDARRMVLHVGDGAWHDSGALRALGVTPALSTDDVAASLAEAGIALAAVQLGGAAEGRAALEALALASGGWAEPCAFDGMEARTTGRCAADACCTGPRGAGRAPTAGRCPLVFDASSDAEVAAALDAAWATLAAQARTTARVHTELPCWVAAMEVTAQSDACGTPPTLLNADGEPSTGLGVETVRDVRPGDLLALTLSTRAVDTRDVDRDGDRTERCDDLGVGATAAVRSGTPTEAWTLDTVQWTADAP